MRNPVMLMVAAFAAAIATFALLNRGVELPAHQTLAQHPRTTDQRLAVAQAVVRSHPGDANQRAILADLYLQKVREGADPSYYSRAGAELARAQRIDRGNSAVYTELGTLALARHHFHDGLAYGLRAHRLAPAAAKPLGVIVDAQVELGRYRDATRTLQTMVDEKPTLSSYSRASYVRELHGDLPGALRAMRLAVSAGGEAPENVAYVQSLLGHLEFVSGHLAAADRAYSQALYRYPGYSAALVGLARVEAARGDLPAALARLRFAVRARPTIESLTALGEVELAAGERARSARHLATARADFAKLSANGENTDTELALLEADYGSPANAVRLGRSAWGKAPSVRSADALGWALTNAGHPGEGAVWARRSLRLGSRDPLLQYHAGIAALRSGDDVSARRWLSAALSLNRGFSPLHARRAERALRSLK